MRRTVVLTVLVAALAACSAQQPEPSPSTSISPRYREEIDQFLRSGTASELQRAILADYWVTDAEMREAEDKMRQCLADAHPDLTVTFKPDGGYEIGPANPFYEQYGEEVGEQKFQEVVSACSEPTVDLIQHFYVEPRRNPAGLTYAELVRRCFDAHGIEDGRGLSEQEFDEMITDSDYSPSLEGLECLLDPYGY